ncbi:MAG: transporter ATP-binding protein [Bacillales bacterium]|nr:transporter ATP-binding protein [Bacillales bacterium]
MPTILSVQHIEKTFDEKVLLDVNLSLNIGDRVALLGKNGAGKTTLIKIISNELKPDSGKIHSNLDFRKQVGIMPQEDILVSDLKTGELIVMVTRMHKQKLFNVDKVLKDFSLIEQKNVYVSSLSGGQKRRLSLLLSMVNDPKLLILDEPTTGMDLESVDNLWKMLNLLSNTTMVVTHDFNQIDKYFNRVIILKNGIIATDRPLKDIHADGYTIEQWYRRIEKSSDC